MPDTLNNVFDDFNNHIINWKKVSTEISVVGNKSFNEIDVNDVRYIIVGDNPGKTEKEKGKYLIGDSGQKLRTFFEVHQFVEDFRKNVVVFNKTPLYSNTTKELKKERDKLKSTNYYFELQKEMAKIVFRAHKVLDFSCPLILLGNGACNISKQTGKVCGELQNFIIELYKLYENESLTVDTAHVYLLHHTSRGFFFTDLLEYYHTNNRTFALGHFDRLSDRSLSLSKRPFPL